MPPIFSLPNTRLPAQYQGQYSDVVSSAQEVTQAVHALRLGVKPTHIIGSLDTSAIWWVAASRLFPEAKLLLVEQDTLPFTEPQPAAENTIKSEVEAKPEVATELQEQKQQEEQEKQAEVIAQAQPPKDNPNDWPFNVFKSYVWKEADADKTFRVYAEKAVEIAQDYPQLLSRLEKHQRQAKHALMLEAGLNKRIAKGETQEEIKAWIDKQKASQSKLVINHLNRCLKRHFNYIKKKRHKSVLNQGFKPSLPYITAENGLHPQSLRALKPSQQWQIIIDETGSNFGIEASKLNSGDKTLGRIVALAMPQNHQLPECISHATDLADSEVEKIIGQILNSPCGVLGATLQEDLKGYSWIAAVSQLVRWALLMLPFVSSERTSVKVLIENRGNKYQEGVSLAAWEESLESELKLLAPERFKNLELELEIVSKDSQYNGYVDAIANCWGSPAEGRRQILARTGWRDTCLLQTTSLERVDNLYKNLTSNQPPSPADWFAICDSASNESDYSLLKDLLDTLGEQAQKNRELWQGYLQEVLQRIQYKTFSTKALNEALTWLNTHCPTDEILPKILQLELGAAQLAAENHLGITNVNKVAEVLDLANKLKDENAPLACSVALRVAVSATNKFDFDSVQPFIKQWSEEPIAIPGLSNHAKLHSTLGQLAAFKGNNQEAIDYFNQALDLFSRLNDPMQKEKNYQQTSIYRAIALLDAQDAEAATQVQTILEKATSREGIEAIKRLAKSGNPSRFEHYLLLRWLVMQPERQAEREAYLSQSNDWQAEDAHPWMLINAYRAWLLVDAGRTAEATELMQAAIDESCDENESAVLSWMGQSLAALGQSLGLATSLPRVKQSIGNFKVAHLSELARAETNPERLAQLAILLPFNFH